MSELSIDHGPAGHNEISPALRGLAVEFSGVFVRLLAYVSGLIVLATIVSDVWGHDPDLAEGAVPARPGWALASRPHPSFAISPFDAIRKPDAHEILRHPLGGRKEVLRWHTPDSDMPVAEIEIYRIGGELDAFADPAAAIAGRMALAPGDEAESAGLVDSKFGPVGLWRFQDAGIAAKSCLGFSKTFEDARLRISGWSCHAPAPAAPRTLIACSLNRLTLLSAGNDPKLAELFARSELRRGECLGGALTADWLSDPRDPSLRGRFDAQIRR